MRETKNIIAIIVKFLFSNFLLYEIFFVPGTDLVQFRAFLYLGETAVLIWFIQDIWNNRFKIDQWGMVYLISLAGSLTLIALCMLYIIKQHPIFTLSVYNGLLWNISLVNLFKGLYFKLLNHEHK